MTAGDTHTHSSQWHIVPIYTQLSQTTAAENMLYPYIVHSQRRLNA